jgi:hypothetical protein
MEEQVTYLELKKKYNKLLDEYKNLKNEYSENTIIQSMNSMKELYEEKEHELDNLDKKYKKLDDSNFYLVETIKAVRVMISGLNNKIKEVENKLKYSYENESRLELHELQVCLNFIDEVIDNSFKKRLELLYSNQD